MQSSRRRARLVTYRLTTGLLTRRVTLTRRNNARSHTARQLPLWVPSPGGQRRTSGSRLGSPGRLTCRIGGVAMTPTTLTAAPGHCAVTPPGGAIQDADATGPPAGSEYWVDPGTDQVYPLAYRAYRQAREAEEKTPARHRTLGPDIDYDVWRRGLSRGHRRPRFPSSFGPTRLCASGGWLPRSSGPSAAANARGRHPPRLAAVRPGADPRARLHHRQHRLRGAAAPGRVLLFRAPRPTMSVT